MIEASNSAVGGFPIRRVSGQQLDLEAGTAGNPYDLLHETY
jgi:hypothetical protein